MITEFCLQVLGRGNDTNEKSPSNILNLTIKDLSKLILAREISPVDLIEATLERIAKLNPTLNAENRRDNSWLIAIIC
jgi:hypothetical protein